MAVYKLGDVCSYIEGYTNPSINNKDFFGGNKINWMRVKDLKNGSSINKTELTLSNEGFNLIKNKNQIFKKGTIVWSKSGTVGNVGLLNINVCANRGILNILPKEKIHKKYLYYFLLKNKNKFQNLSTGAVLKHFYGPNLMNFKINLPSIKIQKQIIDIIEPYEKLFLNYSQCVRIDNIKNTKNDLKNLIDIIEPVEKMIYMNNQIIKKVEYIIMNLPINETLENDIFKKIETGKLNVNAIDENGKYNFYSCSSKVKKTNFNSFNGRYILLSGNGEIYTWWFEGEFDLYQRVYALTEKKSFFTTFLSVKKGLEKIRKRSNGAVIKFIKLSDIKTIKMLNDNYENILKKLFIFQKKLQTLNEKSNVLKNKLVKLLIK